jgi:hypothetical protein
MVYPNGRTIDYPDRSGFRGLAEAAQHACRFTAPLNSRSNNNSVVDNAISRLDSISDPDNGGQVTDVGTGSANSGDAGQVLEQYSYLGLNTIVARNHPQDRINLTLVGSGGSIGSGGDSRRAGISASVLGEGCRLNSVGLDQFGRVVNQNWINSGTGAFIQKSGTGTQLVLTRAAGNCLPLCGKYSQ